MNSDALLEIGIKSIQSEELDLLSLQRAKQRVLEDLAVGSVKTTRSPKVILSRRRLLQGLGLGSMAATVAALVAFPLTVLAPKTLLAQAIDELKHGGLYFEVLQVGVEVRPAGASARVSVSQKNWFAKDGRSRVEDEFGGISISDKFGNLRLQLNSDKTAIISKSSLFAKPTTFFDSWIGMVENGRNLKEVGKETVDGKELVQFQVEASDSKLVFDVWVDYSAKSIARVEFSDTRFQPVTVNGITYIPATKTIISNIKTHQDFDESLFSVTPPDGYTIVKE